MKCSWLGAVKEGSQSSAGRFECHVMPCHQLERRDKGTINCLGENNS
jgi:hypothetical protein